MNDTLNYNFKSVCVKEKMHLKREKNNNIYLKNLKNTRISKTQEFKKLIRNTSITKIK
jgi:hypothetical protein